MQTGVGRTGTFFAFEQLGVRPDLVTLAKGLANGLPIGALLVADDAAGAFAPGDHGSTFGGNPVVVRRRVRRRRGDRRRAARRTCGDRARSSPPALAALPGVVSVRGRGLLLGIEIDRRARPTSSDAAASSGLLVLTAGENVAAAHAAAHRRARDEVDEALAILGRILC